MKLLKLLTLALCVSIMLNSCKKDEQPEGPRLVGQPGNPRFNLVFTNEANVDLDLHVEDPSGDEIYYYNPVSTSKGVLDVDCLCGDCPTGPNENIFWETGKAPKGTYKVWVEYYDDCGNSASRSSDFTLRVVQNEKIIATYTGTLGPDKQTSAIWTHQQQN
jgi:uncharacterized protein YfaP (DUF2135 family)